MSVEAIELPMIINGREFFPDDRRASHLLNYESGISVRVPVMEECDLAAIADQRAPLSRALMNMSTDELTMYLHAAGDKWLANLAEGRRLVNAYAHKITGFHPGILGADYDTVGHLLVNRFHLWDTIAAEFGNERIFDEWIPNQMCFTRAVPRGLLIQYLVGNLPLSALYTILRGILTRNLNLLKLPTRDPVTALGFIQSIVSVDPEHPIARSLSVAYWPHSSSMGDRCLAQADAVCVWGGEEAVEAIKRKVRATVPVSEYGPRWSASFIDLTACDAEEAAIRLVDDVSFYDQEACFNTQHAFVKGDIGTFHPFLAKYCDLFAQRFPLGSGRDTLAHRSATLIEAEYIGYEVIRGHDWAIVVVPPGYAITDLPHPLGRTVFLHQVTDLREGVRQLNQYSQTVSVFPYSLAESLKNDLAFAGANRITDLGWSRMPRQGFSHDGIFGLHPLVRLVTLERTRADFGKYYPAPKDRAKWQTSYLLGEKWWVDLWWEQMTEADRLALERERLRVEDGAAKV